jgi:hypothetical protein
VTAPITSARLIELSAEATGGEWDDPACVPEHMTQAMFEANAALIAALCSEPARAHIIKALSLLERMQARDAGLVEAMISTFFRTTALGAKHTGNVDQLVAQAMADETMRTSFVAALAALVGEVDHQTLGGTDGQ